VVLAEQQLDAESGRGERDAQDDHDS
jgi:hypothetical protein